MVRRPRQAIQATTMAQKVSCTGSLKQPAKGASKASRGVVTLSMGAGLLTFGRSWVGPQESYPTASQGLPPPFLHASSVAYISDPCQKQVRGARTQSPGPPGKE